MKINIIIKSLRGFLLLHDWTLYHKLVEDTPEVGEMEKADYSRFQANLHFRKDYIESESYDVVIELVMHELCHIITMAPLEVFTAPESLQRKNLGEYLYYPLVNEMAFVNEQMNVKLTSIMMREYKKTKSYKKLILKLEKK